MREINRRTFRVVAWVGNAALFCLGLLAIFALVVVMTVLTAVILMSTILPTTAVRQRRDPKVRRDSGSTPELSAARKAEAS